MSTQRMSLKWLLFACFVCLAASFVEDICVNPGETKNFYSYASRLGCKYGEDHGVRGAICDAAVLASNIGGQFKYNSSCRGVVHFDSVYFLAAARGLKQEFAYWFAAFSQMPDFSEFVMFDSCGHAMEEALWTPPMKGFLRTAASYGGTNMHLGIPLVGVQDRSRCKRGKDKFALDCPHLTQKDKKLDWWPEQQQASKEIGCSFPGDTRVEFGVLVASCPGLNVSHKKNEFYDGPLNAWTRWAFNETDVLCNAGFTKLGPDGNPTTGNECPTGGTAYQGDVSKRVSGPIPIQGHLQFGEQVIDWDCEPACGCFQNCTHKADNTNYKKVNFKTVRPTPQGSSMGIYLEQACREQGRTCLQDGTAVPELIARTGILLHYYADRASHWYCTDAPGSGIMLLPVDPNENKTYEYDIVTYLETKACNIIQHQDTHYWEQGMGSEEDYISPSTIAAFHATYGLLEEFATRFRSTHPEWFDDGVKPLDRKIVIGTAAKPGYLRNIVRNSQAAKRTELHMAALEDAGLPPLPGWQKKCNTQEAAEISIERFASSIVKKLKEKPKDCPTLALLKLTDDGQTEGERMHRLARKVTASFDADGNGRLSPEEVNAWEKDAQVARIFEACKPMVVI